MDLHTQQENNNRASGKGSSKADFEAQGLPLFNIDHLRTRLAFTPEEMADFLILCAEGRAVFLAERAAALGLSFSCTLSTKKEEKDAYANGTFYGLTR